MQLRQFNSYKFVANDIKKRLKSLFIWMLCLCGVIIMGMAFYPTFSASGIVDPLSALMETPFFSMIMQMFGVDFRSFAHPFGFYLSYLSIYIV